jgi:DNA-binding NtrC family response regulator
VEVGKTPGTLGTENEHGQEALGGTQNASASQARTGPQARQENAGQLVSQDTPVLSAWIAADPVSLRLIERIRKCIDSECSVLILGEGGAGKGLLADLLHYAGPSRYEPLLKFNCANLPPEMLEAAISSLGAVGTVVLEEIAALSMTAQARLLRALERTPSRLGKDSTPCSTQDVVSGKPEATPAGAVLTGEPDLAPGMPLHGRGTAVPLPHTRLIVLSSVDLERAVARRTFREDLYYRVSVATLAVPPLRERPGDIAPLARHLLAQLADIHRRPHMTFAPAALDALEFYSYPGNVRELRTIIENLVLSDAGSELTLDDLPPCVRAAGPASPKILSLEEIERKHIAEILDFTHGKKSMAAGILGISRKTLLEKRKRYKLG